MRPGCRSRRRASGSSTLKRFGSEPWGYLLRTSDGGRTWRPQLVGTDQPSPDGLVATGSSGAFLLADSRALLFTTSGGDRGDTSKVTVKSKRRKVRRRSVIRITGRVSGANGGAKVLVARRERGERGWVHQTATARIERDLHDELEAREDGHVRRAVGGGRGQHGRRLVPLVVRVKRR